jgi:hypothetical protein
MEAANQTRQRSAIYPHVTARENLLVDLFLTLQV